MKDKTLLILAAGVGSRFGGLKQVEPVGPNNELLIEYSIYDAIKNGFNRVVFVIKKENYELFREKIGKKVEKEAEVLYVFQSVDDLPNGYVNSIKRTKPWGTVQAVLCARDVINTPFLIINADDFYGERAFFDASDFIEKNDNQNNCAVIGYKLKNTLSNNGSVTRGVCEVNKEVVLRFVESVIEKEGDKLIQKSFLSDKIKYIEKDTPVAMNLMVMYPSIFEFFERKFKEFLDKNISDEKEECKITDVLSEAINEGYVIVYIVPTISKWSGVTYREDLDELKSFINEEIKNGVYPEKLF